MSSDKHRRYHCIGKTVPIQEINTHTGNSTDTEDRYEYRKTIQLWEVV